MTPIEWYIICHGLLIAALIAWVWKDDIWGCGGVFWYHTEPWQGHMLCHLGTTHELILFGHWWMWRTRG